MEVKMRSLKGIDLRGKKVLLRPDINSPVDPVTKKIVNDNRIVKTIPVIKELLEKGLDADIDQVEREIMERDQRDSTRAASPGSRSTCLTLATVPTL